MTRVRGDVMIMVMRKKIMIMRMVTMIMNTIKKKLSLVLKEPKHKSGKVCKYQLSGGHIVGKQQEVKYKKEENQSRDFPHMHLWYKHLKIL